MSAKTKTKTMAVAKRITKAPATTSADLDQTFGELVRAIVRHHDELIEFVNGSRGPLSPEVARRLDIMRENAADELANLPFAHNES